MNKIWYELVYIILFNCAQVRTSKENTNRRWTKRTTTTKRREKNKAHTQKNNNNDSCEKKFWAKMMSASMKKSRSLPHIATRHDSGASGITTTTTLGSGSCSLLDHIDYDSNVCADHHQCSRSTSHHSQYHTHSRHCNNGKYNGHNYHHHNHHQQYDIVSVTLFFFFVQCL